MKQRRYCYKCQKIMTTNTICGICKNKMTQLRKAKEELADMRREIRQFNENNKIWSS